MPRHLPWPERFWIKVIKTENCWLWMAATAAHGYGTTWLNGRLISSHRASWIMENGDIPVGMNVLHTCDNPNCVRPSHLFLGTQKQNIADMISKGRYVGRRFYKHEVRQWL